MRKRAKGSYVAAGSLLILVMPLGNSGCGSSGSGTLSDSGGNSSSEANSVAGVVIDDSSNPVADATVAAYGVTASTASDGTFTLRSLSLPSERATIAAQKSGYFDTTTNVIPNPNGQTLVTLMLVKQALIGTLDNTSGGTVTDPDGDVTLTFAPDSFVGTDGTAVAEPVEIYTAYFNPDSPNFPTQMPGGDFLATDTTGTDGALTSYGAIAAEARTSSGKPLQLKSGTTSTGKSKQAGCVTIPSSMRGTAPDTMPVWILGSVTNKWTTMSTATKSGDQYCFDITALGRINCDIFSRFATIKGRVCKDGKPVSGAMVTVNQMAVRTSSDGYYRAIVSSGQTLNITSQYGNTSAGPLQPTTGVCAPDIGTCTGTPCSATSNVGGNGGAGGTSGASGTSISKWGCSTTSNIDSSTGTDLTSCTCVFGAAEQVPADASCGPVTDCCFTFQSSGVMGCSCQRGTILTNQTAASNCARTAGAMSGTIVSSCPSQ